MKILVVAATEAEIAQVIAEVGMLIAEVDLNAEAGMPNAEVGNSAMRVAESQISNLKSQISFLITGVGMVATAFALGRHLAINKYDVVINLGIAGSFDRSISLGTIAEITEDTLAELGAEDDQDFLPLSKLGFGEETFKASARLSDYFDTDDAQQATAITVNTVHGNEASIKKVVQRLNPRLESMEGAAFFYACKQANVPCIQIRSVSNYVEKRNRDNWQIGLAIKNLNNFAIDLLKRFKAES